MGGWEQMSMSRCQRFRNFWHHYSQKCQKMGSVWSIKSILKSILTGTYRYSEYTEEVLGKYTREYSVPDSRFGQLGCSRFQPQMYGNKLGERKRVNGPQAKEKGKQNETEREGSEERYTDTEWGTDRRNRTKQRDRGVGEKDMEWGTKDWDRERNRKRGRERQRKMRVRI